MRESLEKFGVIKRGHFKLSSGKHSNQYINKDAIYCTELFSFVVKKICARILNGAHYNDYDVVTGPAIAGAVLAAPVALKLNKIFLYPEKVTHLELVPNPNSGVVETSVMKFRGPYKVRLKGSRVWVVEDIITTGGSVEKTIKAVAKCGGKVVGISAIWNRSDIYSIGGIPIFSLIDEFVPSYWPEVCPQCRVGELLQDPKE